MNAVNAVLMRADTRRVYDHWRCRFCAEERMKAVSIVRHVRRQHAEEMRDEQWFIPKWVFDRAQWEWRLADLSPELPDVVLRRRRVL